ncbi:MAG: hypothetical protein ACI4SG_01735 [Oligosphaeraceae bacterium]
MAALEKTAAGACQERRNRFSQDYDIVGLKTSDSLKWIETNALRFGYLFQMTFHGSVIREACGETFLRL